MNKYIPQWNAVDVLADDGLLHRGLVVDKTEAGLFIDFKTISKEPVLYPYESIFFDPDSRDLDNTADGTSAHVLFQRTPHQPWKWYPATQLAGFPGEFFLLEFHAEDTHIRDLFPDHLVRQANRKKGENVGKNDFLKEEVPLPDGIDSETAITRWYTSWFGRSTHALGVIGGKFCYIQARHSRAASEKVAIATLTQELELTINPKTDLHEKTTSAVGAAGDHPRGVKRPHEDDRENDLMIPVTDEFCFKNLPFHILIEIFLCMRSCKRAHLRLVCRHWSSVIMSHACRRVVILDIRPPQGRRYDYTDYKFARCLYYCLNERKKYCLVIVGLGIEYFLGKEVDMANQIVGATGATVSTLLLSDMLFEPTDLLNLSDISLSKTFNFVQKYLILRNIEVAGLLGNLGRESERDPIYDVRVSSGVIAVNNCKTIRDVFERHCPDIDEEDYGHLGKWIRFLDRTSCRQNQEVIIAILRQWQCDDTRFGPNCTWRHVMASQVDKNTRSLRKTTLLALVSNVYRTFSGADRSDNGSDDDWGSGY